MTRTLYRRDSLFMRVVCLAVVFTFVLSVSGTTFAVSGTSDPGGSEAATGTVDSAPPVVEDSGRDGPLLGEPPPEEGLPGDVLLTDKPPDAEQPGSRDASEPLVSAVAPSGSAFAAAAPSPAQLALEPVGFGAVDWEAWRVSPPSAVGWAKSNLGQYYECNWIPVRITIDNSDGLVDLALPSFSLGFDYYNIQHNAIAVDEARGFTWATSASVPSGMDPPAGSSALSGVSAGAASSTSAQLIVSYTPAGEVVVPAGSYGFVYFEVHLALTHYWQQQSPARFGAQEYPGSSGQGTFITWNGVGTGSKTISVPVGRSVAPTAHVDGVKFNDLDGDGIRDEGELGLSGWVFTLERLGDFPFTLVATSTADGTFSFTGLPAGSYRLTETVVSPWVPTTTNPLLFELVNAQDKDVLFGNNLPDLTKTWVLGIDTLPVGAQVYVKYQLNAVPTTMGLDPVTLQAEFDAPPGSTITDIEYYALWGGQVILLGELDDETLIEDMTNTFTYDSGVSGMKFHDLDGDGVKDAGEPGLSGWTIILHRLVGSDYIEYARTITGADGTFSFEDVLPGSYHIAEVEQAGWHNTLLPMTFTVANGDQITDRHVGNLQLASSIDVDKSGPALAHVGDQIPYTIVVTNSGNFTLFNVLVTDSLLGTVGTIPSLVAGASQSFTVTRTVLPGDPDPLPNTALATAVDILEQPVSDSDDHVIDILHPDITIEKSAEPTIGLNPTSVLYTYVVTNSGDATLTGVAMTDDKLEVLGAAIGTMTPGQVTTLTATTSLTQSTVNTAQVSGVDALQMTVTDSDTASVAIYSPSIQIVKSVSDDVVLAGTSVTYTFLVTNTGDIPLTDIEVVDDILGPIGIIPVLAADGSATLTRDATIGTDTVNVATATGNYGVAETQFGGTVSATDTASVDVIAPAIEVIKSADPAIGLPGTSVTYTFIVSNTGDVPLFSISVDDDQLGHIGDIAELAVGAQSTLTATSVLQLTTTNTVVVEGMDARENPVTDTDSAMVEIFNPSIGLVKTVDRSVVLSGESVVYTYVVTNNGDIALTDVMLTDDRLGDISSIGDLAPGASITVTTTAAITTDTVNVGTATGDYGVVGTDFAGTVTANDDAEVDVIAPAIQIVKTVAPNAILAGETVVYTYVVTNIGDVPLNDVVVTDDKLGAIGSFATLPVGEARTLTMSRALTVPTINVATVTAVDDFDHEVTDTDDASVDVAAPFTPPDLVIDKSANRATANPGDVVVYTITYRNIGEGSALDMTIVDDFDERYTTVVDAAGGTVANGRITWKVVGPLTAADGAKTITYRVRIDEDLPTSVTRVRNTAVITTPGEVNTEDNEDSWTVTVERFLPFTEPFLPFTGGGLTVLAIAAAMALLAGVGMRRRGRRHAS